jgi:serine/threonine protein kinase
MGEVYRAHDTRLRRTVAIKVLLEQRSDDTEARKRFEREARALSSLSHPHICKIFDIGEVDSAPYVVMEYVDGETLAKRIASGPIPADQVLRIGAEILDALSGAHRQSITHRDLKPANIMITRGHVKLLDFGVAKLGNKEPTGPISDNAPTVQQPLTGEGVVLGTLQYMAPEQILGKATDARTDIFAAGVVVYEMATGRHPFSGDNPQAITASILHFEPPKMTVLNPAIPPALERIVRLCLAKDPEERWQTAADIVLQLNEVATHADQSGPTHLPKRRGQWVLPTIGGVVVGSILATLFLQLLRPKSADPATYHLSLLLPSTDSLWVENNGSPIALSPDGMQVAYAASSKDRLQIYLRDLRSGETTALAGTEGGTMPFFKPDGTAIGFTTNERLKTISLVGGSLRDLGPSNGPSQGGAWLEDGSMILLGQPGGGMARFWPDSGKRDTVTTVGPGDAGHISPQALPGGRYVLFTSEVDGKSFDEARIEIVDLQTKSRKVIYEGGTHARFVPGRIYFAHADHLFSVAFDVTKLVVVGVPKEILHPVLVNIGSGSALYEIAGNGTIVYVPYGAAIFNQHVVWVDRGGRTDVIPLDPRSYEVPRLSPNGKKLLVEVAAANEDLWVKDLTRGTFTRLTFEKENLMPIWSSDSQSVIFSRYPQAGVPVLTVVSADGTGTPRKLVDSPNGMFPSSVSADGRLLAAYENTTAEGWDINVFSLAAESRLLWRFASKFNEWKPTLSPDGRWIAYASDESGGSEIYVQSLEGKGEKTLISSGGGVEPLWSHSGREIFYRAGSRLMSVPVSTTGGFSMSNPHLLFDHPFELGKAGRSYDVAPDDQHFVFIERSNGEERKIRRIDVIVGRPPAG